MGHPYWPLFDLEVRTPHLTLRVIDDELAPRLAALAARGIHDPATMPFLVPWTDAPSPLLERNALRHWWRNRAELTRERWVLDCAVLVDGDVAGSVSLRAEHFPVLRTVETGSWIARALQGRGLGRETREAVLHLGFAGLDAQIATTGAFADNAASLAVTRRLGYEPAGLDRVVRRGEAAEVHRFRMHRSRWEAIRRTDIDLRGVAPVRALLAP